jgi:endonuclease/exonuclease/phosphatase family metal-dependent hydrolase
MRRIAEIAGRAPVVVTGDFNSTDQDAAYKTLTSGSGEFPALSDSRPMAKIAPCGSTQSFNGFSPELKPGHCIDFVFVRNVGAVLRHGIISEKWDGRFVSDHYPVLAEIVVREKG